MRRSIPLVIVGLVAGLLAGGSVGVIVGATTVPQIHACAAKTTLVMRYTSTTTCRAGEKLLAWNVQGVTGVAGATGAQGATGATGPAGGGGQPNPFYLASGPSVQQQGTATMHVASM